MTLRLTGDGYFNLSNRGIITWFCPPAVDSFIGNTFSTSQIIYLTDLAGPLSTGPSLSMDVNYNPAILKLNSIMNGLTDITANYDTAQPGVAFLWQVNGRHRESLIL